MVEYHQSAAHGLDCPFAKLKGKGSATVCVHNDDNAGGDARPGCPRPCLMTSGRTRSGPFAIVIVGGLIVELVVSVILWPTLYVFWARPGDKLPPC